MDACAVSKLNGAGGHFNVFPLGAGQGTDARSADGLGDGGDGREVALGRHGEAGLDDVHAEVFKGMGHGELFLGGHAAAGRLLAVAQGGVKEDNVIWSLSHGEAIRIAYNAVVSGQFSVVSHFMPPWSRLSDSRFTDLRDCAARMRTTDHPQLRTDN